MPASQAPPPSIVIESGPVSLCSDTIVSAVGGEGIPSLPASEAAISADPAPSPPQSVLSLTVQQGALGAAIISKERPHLLHLVRPKMDRVGFPTVEDCNMAFGPPARSPPPHPSVAVILEHKPTVIITPGRGAVALQSAVQDTFARSLNGLPPPLHLRGLATEYKLLPVQNLFQISPEDASEAAPSVIHPSISGRPLLPSSHSTLPHRLPLPPPSWLSSARELLICCCPAL